jgi:hypothetical protein
MNNDYRDIINLPHHRSTKHPHMPVKDRAAAFSPFAALTGYDAAVKGQLKKVDELERALFLSDGSIIPIEAIVQIERV